MVWFSQFFDSTANWQNESIEYYEYTRKQIV